MRTRPAMSAFASKELPGSARNAIKRCMNIGLSFSTPVFLTSMFSHRFDQSASNTVVLHWFMLSFNGGFINAGGFLATGRFVSHVTGFATLFGVGLTKNEANAALGILSVPIFFLLGAFIAGLLIDRPI